MSLRFKRALLPIALSVWALVIYKVLPMLFARDSAVIPHVTHEDLQKKLQQEIEGLRARPSNAKALPLVSIGNEGLEDVALKFEAQEDTVTDEAEELKGEEEQTIENIAEDTTEVEESGGTNSEHHDDGVESTDTKSSKPSTKAPLEKPDYSGVTKAEDTTEVEESSGTNSEHHDDDGVESKSSKPSTKAPLEKPDYSGVTKETLENYCMQLPKLHGGLIWASPSMSHESSPSTAESAHLRPSFTPSAPAPAPDPTPSAPEVITTFCRPLRGSGVMIASRLQPPQRERCDDSVTPLHRSLLWQHRVLDVCAPRVLYNTP
eukprot:9498617-Pyramimonas_sp.AAC.2